MATTNNITYASKFSVITGLVAYAVLALIIYALV